MTHQLHRIDLIRNATKSSLESRDVEIIIRHLNNYFFLPKATRVKGVIMSLALHY